MSPEEFFEKFETFAELPGAVEKLRYLIVSLGVRGELIPNDPNEPAVSTKLLSGASQSSPINWRHGNVSDVFDFQYGKNLPAKNRSETGEYPVYGSNGVVGTHNECVTEQPAIIVGRKGSAGALNIAIGPSWTTDVAYFVIPPEDVDLRFTYLLFSTLGLDGLGKGIKPGLSRKEAYALPISLPPLAEQKRIVAKVDALMGWCDRLEVLQAQRDTQHAALARAALARFADNPTPQTLQALFHDQFPIQPNDLRKAILTLAVQGKLIQASSRDEPACELLKRVMIDKEALAKERKVRLSKTVEYSIPDEAYVAPPHWVAVYINDVAIIQGGKRLPNGAVFSEKSTPYCYIRVTDMKNGSISETGLRYISADVQRKIARYVINKEDLYITIAGTIGEVGYVPESLDGHNLTENAAKIVFRGFDRRFFKLVLSSDFIQSQFINKTKQMAQPKLALKRIAGAKFYLPPLAEQRRIVAKVDELMALVDRLDEHQRQAHDLGQRLLTAAIAELTAVEDPIAQ